MKTINLIVLTLLLTGCGIFEPLGEMPEPVIAKEQEQQETDDYDGTLIITPSTWFGEE